MSDDRYGEGYLDALEHVQELLVDEAFYFESDPERHALIQVSRIIDAWKDTWKETHAS